jgi:hypothetical protein
MKLFYSGSNSQLIGYADAGYLSDPHKREITNRLSIYRWRYCNFLKICQIKISGYFIKSFRNYCNPWNKSRMYMAKVNYPTHKKNTDCQPLKIVSQYCLKIMPPASLNLEEATLKETKQNIYHQSSFIVASFNRKENWYQANQVKW